MGICDVVVGIVKEWANLQRGAGPPCGFGFGKVGDSCRRCRFFILLTAPFNLDNLNGTTLSAR